MSIPNENIIFLTNKVKPLLDECRIPYWLGRGIVADILVNGEIKCKHSDVDFHIMAKDSTILKEKLIPEFEKEGDYITEDRKYKLAFYKPANNPSYYVEFPYIFEDENDSKVVYHESCGKKYYCLKECFNLEKVEKIKINEIEFRIPTPTEQYLRDIYNDDNWRVKYEL